MNGNNRAASNGDNGKVGKRKKVQAVTVFMRELRSQESGFNQMSMSNMNLIQRANLEFDRLPRAEQERYDIMAKKENAERTRTQGHTYQKDTLGFLAADRGRLDESHKKWIENARSHISELVSAPNLFNRVWVVGHVLGVEHLDDNDASYTFIPTELTFAKFSFEQGLIGQLTLHPRTTNTPMGQVFTYNTEVESAMGFKPDVEYDNVDYQSMWTQIKKFCGQSGQQCPIFVRRDNMREMRYGLFCMCERGGLRCPWVPDPSLFFEESYVYSLDELFGAFLCVGDKKDNFTNEDILAASRTSDRTLKELPLWVTSQGGSCQWHMDYSLQHLCAQNGLQCTIQSLFLSLASYFPNYIDLTNEAYLSAAYRDYLTIQESRAEQHRNIKQESSWCQHAEFPESEMMDPAESALYNEMDGLDLRRTNDTTASVNSNSFTKPKETFGIGRGKATTKASMTKKQPGADKKRRVPRVDF